MKPQMHKSVMVYNSDFKIVPQSEIQVEVKDIPTVEQNQSSAPQAVKVIHFEDMKNDITTESQTSTNQNVSVNTQTAVPQRYTTSNNTYTTVQTTPKINNRYQNVKQVVPTQTQTVTQVPKTTTTTKVQTPTTTTKVNTPQKVVTNTPQIDLQKILDNNKKYQNTQTQQTTTAPAPVKTTTTTTPTKIATAPVGSKTTTPVVTKVPTPAHATTTTKVLTPQEEEIAWQIWRSNLQNKIMQDAKLPNVPQGTIFKFTFDVDKYGKVSNIHTSCTNNAQYTPYAIQYIAPVIRAYQGRSILNFPEGSKRVTTSFVGSFKVSNSSKYSTAGDYKDTERVFK
jgi:hypothetical protein